jgi:hypothetical protein
MSDHRHIHDLNAPHCGDGTDPFANPDVCPCGQIAVTDVSWGCRNEHIRTVGLCSTHTFETILRLECRLLVCHKCEQLGLERLLAYIKDTPHTTPDVG